jgi:hypothetical protein
MKSHLSQCLFAKLLHIGACAPLLVCAIGFTVHAQDAEDARPAANQATPATANFGPVNVGSSAATPLALDLTFDNAGTLGSSAVLTQGAPGLDFTDAGGGTCKANTAYNAGDTCTVVVNFKPKHPGARYGGVELLDGSGNLLAAGYVQGSGVGPQVTFANTMSGDYLPSVQSHIGGPGETLTRAALDGSGNIFISETYINRVVEVMAAGGYATTKILGSEFSLDGGFSAPGGLAVDGNGNLFVADVGHNAVKEIVAAGGYTTIKTLGSGFYQPTNLAVDGTGNLFVTEYDRKTVKEILAAGGYTTIKTLGSGFTWPGGLAVDGNGNVFVTDIGDTGSDAVKEILAAGGYTTVKTLASGFNNLVSVAVDGNGNLFVSDMGDRAVKEIVAVGGSIPASPAIRILGSGFVWPSEAALDGSGNVFVLDQGSTLSDLIKLDYADPPSLTFAAAPVGSQSSDSPQTVTVTNNGNAALTFPIPGSGNNPSISSGFTLDSATTCPELSASSDAAGTLAVGASCDYAVDSIPTAFGVVSGSLLLTDNNLNIAGATQSIGLNGNGVRTPPAMTTPQPGSTLTCANLSDCTVTFTWTPGTGSSNFRLILGTGYGIPDVYNGAPVPYTTTSVQISHIPVGGWGLYARLYYEVNGTWSYIDYSYAEAGTTPPTLTSPQPGTTLSCANLSDCQIYFNWFPGSGSPYFRLLLGTKGPGSSDVYSSPLVPYAQTVSYVSNIPANARTLYARLYYYLSVYGTWSYIDYTYTEAGSPTPPSMSTPAPESTLSCANLSACTVNFTWNPGNGSSYFRLLLGTTGAGSSDVYSAPPVPYPTTSAQVSNIPADARTLYARLYYYRNGVWSYIDYTYTEAGSPTPPSMSTPAPESTLSCV